ncbi:T9SS type A sorting domain-containing protein [Polaribacter sp. R77954]|uniref:T9SS type A sorting domain-containing protein n=1 Tax=Polaribacter sp. R77954 TaxID=3093870 RepID=UPI0037C70C96
MKKIILMLCVLFSLNGIAQTWDFKTSQSKGDWTAVASTQTIVSTGLQVAWADDTKPKTIITTAAINAATNKLVAITLTNSSSSEINVQFRHRKNTADDPSTQRYLANAMIISPSFSTPRTYIVDLTETRWDDTVNEFDIVFRDSAGNNIPTAGSLVIQKVEFVSVQPTNYTYLFNADGYTEGFTTIDATASVADGVLTFTPNAIDVNPKLRQSSFRMLQTDVTHVHITYKNESALNDELRITYTSSTGSNGGKQWTIGTNDTEYKTITHELAAQANQWNAGNIATDFTILIREAAGNLTDDTGALKIQSIVFSNSATPPNMFEGGTDSDWATAANWSLNEVPASGSSNPVNDVVTIPEGSNPVIGATTAAEVTDLTVDSDGSLTITGGGSLIVSGTSTGDVTYTRNLATGGQWYLMSSPVIGETYDDAWVTANGIASGSDFGTNRGVSMYDNSSFTDPHQAGSAGHWRYMQSGGSDTFDPAKGYGIIRTATGGVSFTGTLRTANQNFTLEQGANNVNFVGNPFTAYITLGTFHTTNTANIGTDFYFWDGSSYVTRTSGGDATFEIAPGQGFFLDATSTNDVTFEVSDLSHQGSDSFHSKSANNRAEVKLYVNEGANQRFARVLYIDGQTTGLDLGYDGKLFGGVSHNFAVYSHLVNNNEGVKYQIQSLPNQDFENNVVPLGVIAASENEITFSAETINLPAGLKVYLEDRLTNTFTRLDEADTNYKVQVASGTTEGRFFLHTKSSSVLSTEDALLNSVSIYKTSNTNLKITGLKQGKTSISLYNLLGKKVMATSFNASNVNNISLPNLSTGVYIVQLETENGKLNKKIVLE